MGIHPWHITPALLTQQYAEITSYASQANCLALGEIGLDKICSTPWDLQLEVFEKQIDLANTLHKPVIIHCVKAQQEILKLKSKAKTPWILHGFNQKAQVGHEWLRHDFYLSFGKALLEPDSNASQFLPQVPLDKLFLETDQAQESIETIYKAACERLDLPLEKLDSILQVNFNRIFSI